jgi:hypothetical protein
VVLEKLRRVARVPESTLELVLVANLFAAAALGIAALWSWDVPFVSGVVLAGLTFVGLTAFMFWRATVWIAAIAGGLVSTAAVATVFWSFGVRVSPVGGILGAAAGAALGGSVCFRAYSEFVRVVSGGGAEGNGDE